MAFGRPLLRKGARPAVNIPPLKKRRLTYGDDEDEDGVSDDLVDDRQVVLRRDLSEEEDEEDDSALDDEEDLDEELRDLHDEDAWQEGQQAVAGQRRSSPRRRPRGLGLLNILDQDGNFVGGLYHNPTEAQHEVQLENSALVSIFGEEGHMHLQPYHNPLLDEYSQDEPHRSIPALRVRKRRQTRSSQFSKAGMKGNLQDSSATPEPALRRDSASSNKSVRFQDQLENTPATIEEHDDSDDEDDGDFELDGVESDKENAPPRAQNEESTQQDHEVVEEDSSSFSEPEPSDSDWTSSSGTSSSSSSDSESEAVPSNELPAGDNDSSFTSSSDSDSDSDKDVVNSPAKPTKSSSSSSTSSSSGSDSDSELEQIPRKSDISPNTSVEEETRPASVATPPYMGKKTTKARNVRRRKTKVLAALIAKDALPSDANYEDLQKFRENNKEHVEQRRRQRQVGKADPKPGSAEFESRRKALLDSLASGGVGIDEGTTLMEDNLEQQGKVPEIQHAEKADGLAENERSTDQQTTEVATTQAAASPVVHVQDSLGSISEEARLHSTSKDVSQPQSQQKSQHTQSSPQIETSPRRPKLNLAGSKRLLFGSLGLKTPKNKEDESTLQAKLMKNVKPVGRRRSDVKDSPEIANQVDPDDESWKEKIDLRAVECCHEGVELSTPPFPFKQRWDPQQQSGYGRRQSKKKTKHKKRKRNDNTYYQNEYEDSFNDHAQRKSPRREEFEPSNAEPQYEDSTMDYASENQQNATGNHHAKQNDDIQLDYTLPDDDWQDAQRADDQLIREATESAANAVPGSPENPIEVPDDLPEVAEDRSVYKELKVKDCKPGAIVAFQQLEMSPEGGWQPTISTHRTAIIDSVEGDNIVNMILAKRDRPQPKQTHSRLGERIYARFEMPDYSDEDNHDPSRISVIFAELIDPLLLRAADPETYIESREDKERKRKRYEGNLRRFNEIEWSPSKSRAKEQPGEQSLADERGGESNSKTSVELDDLPDFEFYERQMQDFQDHSELTISEPRRHSEPNTTLKTEFLEAQDVTPRPAHSDPVHDSNIRQVFERPVSQPQERTESIALSSPVAAQPSTQARNDISVMMNDAGWQSSVGSAIKKGFQLPEKDLFSPASVKSTASHVPTPGLRKVAKGSKFLILNITPRRGTPVSQPSTPRNCEAPLERRRRTSIAPSPLFVSQSPSPSKKSSNHLKSMVNYWDRTPSGKQTRWFGLEVGNVSFDRKFFLPALRAAGLETQPEEIEFHNCPDAVTIWHQSYHERKMVRAMFMLYLPGGKEENQLRLRDAGTDLTPEHLPTRSIPGGTITFPNIIKKMRELVQADSTETASRPVQRAPDPVVPASDPIEPASDHLSDPLSDPVVTSVLPRKKVSLPKGLGSRQIKWYGLAIGNISFDHNYFLPALHAGGLDTLPEEVQPHFKKGLITIWFQTDRQRKNVREALRNYCGDSKREEWLWLSESGCDGTPPELPFRRVIKNTVDQEKLVEKLSQLVNASGKETVPSPMMDTTVEYPTLPQLEGDSEIFLEPGQRGSPSFAINSSDQLPSTISPPSLRRNNLPASPTLHAKTGSQVNSNASSRQSSQTQPAARHSGPFLDSDSDSDEFPELFSQKFEQRLSQSTFIKPEQFSQESNNSSAPKKATKQKTTKTAKAKAAPKPTSKPASQRSSNQSSLPNLKMEDDSLQSLPQWQQSSQIPQSSQFVDLTISSDPFEVPDHGYDDGDDSYRPSSSLPTGSGWIEKPSTKKGGSGASKRKR